MFRMFRLTVVVAVASLIAGSLVAAPAEGKFVPKVASLTGRDSIARALSLTVVNTPAEWREMAEACFSRTEAWAQVMRYDKAGAELPNKRGDFNVSRSMEPPASLKDNTAICVFTGKLPSGVPWLEMTSVVERADAVVVDFKITVPENVARAVMDPSCYTIVFVPKTTKPVVFRTAGQTVVATVGGVAGGNVVEGLQIALEPKPAVWRPGDPIEFALKATNVSDKPVRVPAWGMDADQILEFTDAKGNVLANPGFARKRTRQMAPADFPTIEPGGSFRFLLQGFMHELDGKRWLSANELRGGSYGWTLPEGDYALRAVMDSRADDERNRVAGGECWTGRVYSSPVKVAYRAETLAWGEPVNGASIALEAIPNAWAPGDAIEFACTVKNTTDAFIRMSAWGLDLGQALEITDSKGNVLPSDGGRNGMRMMPANAGVLIPPKELWRFTLPGQLYDNKMLMVQELLGGVWSWKLADGDYTVRAVLWREAPKVPPAGVAGSGVLWTGKALSAPIKVIVAPKSALPTRVDLTPLAPLPGRPVKDLELTLSAERTLLEMTARELRRATADTPRWNVAPVKLRLTFTNAGDKPIKLDAYDIEFSRMTLDAFGPDGKSVRIDDSSAPPRDVPPEPNPGEVRPHHTRPILVMRDMPPPGEADYPTIEPGKSWTCTLRSEFPGTFGTKQYTLLKPGDYNLKVTYSVPEASDDLVEPSIQRGRWRGSVTSNFVELTAGPAGEPMNGLKMTISADKTDLRMTPHISVTFTNVSDDPITVDAFDFLRHRLRVHVDGPEGGVTVTPRQADVGVERTMRGPLPSDYHAIEPGQSWTFENTIGIPGDVGAKTYSLKPTGNYKLHVSYTSPERPDVAARGRPANTWTGTLVSNEIVLKGVEADAPAPAKVELAAAPAAPDKAPEAPKAGEAVNGLKLTLGADGTELKMLPRTYLRSGPNSPRYTITPVKLSFTFTNAGDKPIKLDVYDLVWSRVRLDVQGPAAGSVLVLPLNIDRKMVPPAEKDYPTIEPGKSYTYGWQPSFPGEFGDKNYILQTPGEYRVSVSYLVSEVVTGKEMLFEQSKWRGSVASNEIVLKGVEEAAPPAAAAAVVGPDAKVAEGAAVKPGEPVDGLKLTLSADATEFKMKAREYRRSGPDSPPYWIEPVKLTFTFANVSDKPVKLDTYDIVWSRLTLNVVGPQAGSVKIEKRIVDRDMAAPVEKDYPTIEPGKTWICTGTFPGDFGAQTCILQTPGEYRVSVGYSVLYRGLDSPLEGGRWHGSVTSNEIVLKGVAAEEKPAAPARVELAEEPGKAVKGLKLAVSADKTELKMTPRSYRRAALDSPRWWVEQTKLSFTFTNVSDKPIKIDAYDLDWSRVKIDVQGPDGESVRIDAQPINRELAAPTEEDYPTFAPGESLAHKDHPLFPGVFAGNNYIFLKPGEYRIKVTYSVPELVPATAVERPRSPFEEGIWRGVVISNEIVLTASLPPGEKAEEAPAYKLGDAVRGLKLTLAAEKPEFKMTPRDLLRATRDTPRWNVEPVNLIFTFTNVSDKPLKVNVYDLVEKKMHLTVTGPNGDSVQKAVLDGVALPTARIPPGAAYFPVIEPGKTYTCSVKAPFPGDFAFIRYVLMEPGEYKLTALYDNTAKLFPGDTPLERDVWMGRVVSNEIVLKGVGVGQLARIEDVAAPGAAVKGLKLSLAADKPELQMTEVKLRGLVANADRYLAEMARLTLTFTNVSDKPITLDAYDIPWRLLDLDAVGSEADSVWRGPARAKRQLVAPAAKDYPTIAPGKSWSCPVTIPGVYSDKEYRLRTPGEYKVKVLYTVAGQHGADGKPQFGAGAWTGAVASNEVMLKCVVAEEKPAAPARVELAEEPGKAVNGLKLVVSADKTDLAMTRRNYARSAPDSPPWNVEPAMLSFTFTNVSDKPIMLNAYDLVWSRLKLDVAGPDAGSVRVVKHKQLIEREMAAPTEKDYPVIDPGKSFTCAAAAKFPGYFGGTEYILLKPGECRVKVVYDLAESAAQDRETRFWKGSVTSNEIVLKGVVAEAKPAGETPAVKPGSAAPARSTPTGFPMDDSAVQDAVLKAVKELKEPVSRMIKPVAPQVDVLVSNSPATGGRVEIPSPLVNTVFRQVLLGYGPAAPRRIFVAVDREGKIRCPFPIEDFGAVLAKEDVSKWTDREYLDAAKLYVHLTTMANADGWCVLSKPQDFMDITFNMRRDEEGVKQRRAVADRITPAGVKRAPDKLVVTFWAWHNIMGRVVQWSVDFGKTFAGSPNEVARFGGGGYD